jgi:predicted polyphosphate/ATP-dependent NAD kinase
MTSPLTIGFLVNPIAGMGGKVGLKGTDGMYEEAVRRGAVPVAQGRALTSLRSLGEIPLNILTCSGAMGEEILLEAGIKEFRIVYEVQGVSGAQDTRNACHTFEQEKVDLILFCGGDGTARDVLEGVGDRVPILGIPAGVKMYSAVFGVNPSATAEIVTRWKEARIRLSEVVDVDEDAYRKGVLATRIYGFARMPYLPHRAQGGKQVFEEGDEEMAKDAIGRFIREIMEPETLYILGAGTTTAHIATLLGVEKTLLGIDVVQGGRLLAKDADEQMILSLLKRGRKVKIIVSPIGAQGFILGRGTQALSPEVLRRVGVENVIVVATPFKLSQTRDLYVDTGDPALDTAFGDSILVISHYHMGIRRKLLHPGPKT